MPISVSVLLAYVFNALWQVPLLVLAAEASTRLLAGMRAVVMHRIWVGCLFLAILLPAASFLHPPTGNFEGARMRIANLATFDAQALSAGSDRKPQQSPINTRSSTPSSSPQGVHAIREVEGGLPWLQVLSSIICVLYVASVLFAVSRLVWGIDRTRRLLSGAVALRLKPDLRDALRTCLAAFEVTHIDVLSSSRLSSPATLTWRKPVVILPADLQGAEVCELTAAFCHELAHVRRGDFLLNLLYQASAVTLFFHPALHWILRRLGETRELVCDDLAADAFAGRRAYAHNLLRLAQKMCAAAANPQSTCALGVFETDTMEKRVMNLIQVKAKHTRLQVCMSVALGAALFTGAGALSTSLGLNPVFAEASGPAAHVPSGWILAGDKPANYRTGVDKQVIRDSRPSAYLVSTVPDTGGFGTLMQAISASQYAGKRVRLRAWVRAKGVAGWAGLWMRVDKGDKVVGFDNMEQRAIRGTQAWTMYDVVLDVPADATGISFGTLLGGTGEVWLNDVRFEVVGQEVRTTDTGSKGSLPAAPVNLNFRD